MLRTACTVAATWPDDIKVAVNVSPVQFKSGNLLQLVINGLAASRLPAQRLELEITEAVFVDEATLVVLHQLRKLGVRIVMDDFGTGYSSLSYLQRFPFDKIKIDGSFIRDVAEKDDSRSIVQAVVGIAKARNITTTAECVETQQQLESLRTLGCTEMQGYCFRMNAFWASENLDAFALRPENPSEKLSLKRSDFGASDHDRRESAFLVFLSLCRTIAPSIARALAWTQVRHQPIGRLRQRWIDSRTYRLRTSAGNVIRSNGLDSTPRAPSEIK